MNIEKLAVFFGVPYSMVTDCFTGGSQIGSPSSVHPTKWCGVGSAVNASVEQWVADAPQEHELVGVWVPPLEDMSQPWDVRPVYALSDMLTRLEFRKEGLAGSPPKDNYSRMKYYKNQCEIEREGHKQMYHRAQQLATVVDKMDELAGGDEKLSKQAVKALTPEENG